MASVNRILYDEPHETSSNKYLTADEDNRLHELKTRSKKLTWDQILNHFPRRTLSGIKTRWGRVLSVKEQCTLRYTSVTVAWSHAEVYKAQHLKEDLKLRYRDMLAHFPGRSIPALSSLFCNTVRGSARMPFTTQEDALILKLRAANHDLPAVAKQLSGRTALAISRRLGHLRYRQYVKEREAKGDPSFHPNSEVLPKTAKAETEKQSIP